MASSSTFEAKVLMAKGKRATAAYIHADCSNSPCPQHLNAVLDSLLNPARSIDEWETIDWCKWLMAGGRTPDEFANTVRAYDNQTTCGLVWTPNFVAYRCRTCGISPCMSLCTDCFKKGNHQRHDFNMFLSQAGGACDCGDTSVMKETGFCDQHGPDKSANKGKAPNDLMCVAEAMMPRIIFRFILHLRENCHMKGPIQDADGFITMLVDFNNMGALMRRVMTSALTNPQKYRDLNEIPENCDSEYAAYITDSKRIYEEALASLANPEPLEEYKDCPSLHKNLVHKTFLEELVFWTVMFEFPEKVVCLLLNMLPDPDYKEALMRAIVLHYSRISMMLERTNDPENVSNRVVHASVQLFSNESLALRMTEQLNLLHVMVVSLRYMMSKILVENSLHDAENNFHYVVDCSKRVMTDHCYWPLVSDLNNVLSHRPVALKFMSDDMLIKMWFGFLAMFQGMNVNQRETKEHVKFEPNTYFAAFSAELEASAYPMWALVSHLTDSSTADLTRKVLSACLRELRNWLEAITFTSLNMNDNLQVSFHLPLHRYFSVFLCQAVSKQGITLDEVLPSNEELMVMIMHPLRVQVAFYEILNDLWVRNGLQIKGQAMTYIQGNFCNSMVDADLYLLQIACTRMNYNDFISLIIDKFHVTESLSLAERPPQNPYLKPEHNNRLLESFLTFLATLVTVRTNIGLSETELNRLEMATLLCMTDRTHSQLMELMPERCGTSQTRDFETLLAELADYKPPILDPSGGNLQQGMYSAKPHVWENLYDPIHVLLRAVHRRDFHTSMDRYTDYVKDANKLKSGISPWLPFRAPTCCSKAYDDPRLILKSRVFHAIILVILQKAVRGQIPEDVTALIIFLLDQAVTISERKDGQAEPKLFHQSKPLNDMNFDNWYSSDCIFENLATPISKIVLTPEPEVSPMTYSSDSDIEWENSEVDTEMSDVNPDGNNILMLQDSTGWDQSGTDLMVFVPQDSSPGFEPANPVLALPPATSMEVDTMTVAVTTRSHSETSVLPAITAGNEVARPWTGSELVPSTSSASGHRRPYRRRPTLEGGGTTPPTVELNESIISLLLKLHSQLSGVPDSFKGEEDEEEGRGLIGDGPFFIGRLLKKISRLDEGCRRCVLETRIKLWPSQEERDEAKRQKENREKEERRRRAKERQQKLMAEFASKQKQFMEAMETDDNVLNSDEELFVSKQEYDCVICNQATPSTEEKPMGLVVWIQATSVIGHRRRHGQSVLPTCDDERTSLRRDDTLSAEFDRRLEELNQYFDPKSWYLSVNVGWDGGVHVQTCGHHLHLDCLNSYLQTLRSQQRGEYFCPLCRQLANSVLPLAPQLGDCAQMVRSNPSSMSQILDELSDFLRENDQKPSNTSMAEAIGKIMEVMTSSTQLKPMLRSKSDRPIPQSLFLFVTSIARTNLETELSQRGGTLVMSRDPPNPLLPKRDCIVPLLHVLSVHARVARVLAMWPAWMTFQQLCGLPPKPPSDTALAPVENEVPLLLRDPVALLLQFILLLPLHLDQNYFITTVQMVYNLLYYQVVVQISCGLSGAERARATAGANEGKICTLTDALALINRCLGHTALYMEDDDDDCSEKPQVNMVALELQVQKLCLPYLRIASLLKYHIYQQPLPDVRAPETEFVCLVHYLELVTEQVTWDCNAAAALNWPIETQMYAASPQSWCNQYAVFVAKSQIAARSFLVDQHITWHPPRLLKLPREYEKIFTYYHKRPCSQCQSVPQETGICLMCGTIVCLKQLCCKQQNICEATAHASECGAGTGVFLVVTSTYIIVIRRHKACLWGSLYLDDFEEEDRDLKRGKPLYLSKERYQLLEQQWLAHRFDHIEKTWIQHGNAL
ncbi:E3 ubiquitin-protein ligase Ubr3 [Tribolium madens]|uniref:E3 ubiquitin-protein ligase Ubr3 n=1 Tax=Tribolium madens TaxID=41895 RepID=UPI001CF730DC|nr:E3 ubiquitin-protein ligase Ubr3 [Tribolium madens]